MDNVILVIMNNIRMEKWIVLECGKRKLDEVELVVF